jgi:rhodanese-related sulfurtransferase
MAGEVDPEAVEKKVEETQIIDIRDPGSYREGHIPGSRNVPAGQFAQRVADIEWEEDIVVACYIGKSSKQAASALETYEGVPEGASVASMAGGLEAWEGELEEGVDEANADDTAAPF